MSHSPPDSRPRRPSAHIFHSSPCHFRFASPPLIIVLCAPPCRLSSSSSSFCVQKKKCCFSVSKCCKIPEVRVEAECSLLPPPHSAFANLITGSALPPRSCLRTFSVCFYPHSIFWSLRIDWIRNLQTRLPAAG